MGEIIAQTYEIMDRIGAGGGGNVFLARHLRLDKMVVLKADKRRLSTRPELLRREVDVLKDLSHTYIPQVYDFFVENDTVYTVMDYVQGESLDRPLKRGVVFPQAQVIQWGRELLEALDYLHSPTHGDPPRGFVHSDIKPANLMVKPDGHICLIDFNIALALGEESVIGGSAGYASPEHYGLDYSFSSTQSYTATESRSRREDDDGTITMPAANVSRTSGKRVIVPDVRSDIYSVGATLYHLLSGRRPARSAVEVIPLGAQEASPQIVAIITKAMSPNPDLRYQSAAEMLAAFNGLFDNDPRTLRRRRALRTGTALLASLFLVGGVMTFTGQYLMRQAESAARQEAVLGQEEARKDAEAAQKAEEEAQRAEEAERQAKLKEQEAKEALEAVSGAESALASGDRPGAIRLALQALEKDTIYNSQAQKVLTDALGVYDLSDGFKARRTLALPAPALELAVSPGGTRLAAVSDFKLEVFDLRSGELLAELPTEESALADAVFLSEDTLVYASPGALRAYDLAGGRELWQGAPATSIVRSSDGSRIAAVYKNEKQAAVYDAKTGALVKTVDFLGRSQPVLDNDRFADPKDTIFALNASGTRLAVSFSDGSLDIFDLQDPEGDLVLSDASDYNHFEGGFCGDYFAFSAKGGGDSVFAVIDTLRGVQTAGTSSPNPYLVKTDDQYIYLANGQVLVRMVPSTGAQTELAFTTSGITGFAVHGDYACVTFGDMLFQIYGPGAQQMGELETGFTCDFLAMTGDLLVEAGRDTPSIRVLGLDGHADANIFSYDPFYVHDEARLSADGSTVMLFRFDTFRLYGRDGQIIADVDIPDSGQVYDQQYRRDEDGSRLDVIYLDGTLRTYSAADGSLLSETQGDPPDATLYEEFLTDRLRITSPLHGTPAAYDRETGELVAELEQDAYLAYVTQVGDYVITEYVTAQGQRYGLILNDRCETLAYLPELCDILGDQLIFDTPAGTLRICGILSLEDLKTLAGQVG